MPVRHIPVRPDLDQLKNQARDLLRAIKRGNASAIEELRTHHPRDPDPLTAKLADAQLRVTERFRRKDFGHICVEVTINDPKTYTNPWTVTLPLLYQPESELPEYMCNENDKDIEHLVGK